MIFLDCFALFADIERVQGQFRPKDKPCDKMKTYFVIYSDLADVSSTKTWLTTAKDEAAALLNFRHNEGYAASVFVIVPTPTQAPEALNSQAKL